MKRRTYDAEGNKTEEWSDSNDNSLFDGNESRYNWTYDAVGNKLTEAPTSASNGTSWVKRWVYTPIALSADPCAAEPCTDRAMTSELERDLQSVETISTCKIGATTDPSSDYRWPTSAICICTAEALEAVGGGGLESPLTDQGVCLDPERL